MAYYKTIDGKKYDKALLEQVEKFAADGQVGYPEAKQLWEDVQDGGKVTDIERATLDYAMKNYKFTDKASMFMKTYLSVGKHTSYYKQIDGVKYDRQLLEDAMKFAADGQISQSEAKQLFEDAQDGKGVTGTEKSTLEYILKEMTFTESAKKWLEKQLGISDHKSYYKVVKGVKYDRSLFNEVEEAAKDGVITEAEAKSLWESALDGKGVTQFEKATLKYALDQHGAKFDEAAKAFLTQKVSELESPPEDELTTAEPEKEAAPPAEKKAKTAAKKKYDKKLLEQVKKFAADGQVGYPEAKLLWEDVADDGVVTDLEKATLEFAMKKYPFTDKAASFIKTYLSIGVHKSFYKQIDGVKYDRQLLEDAMKYAADGQISWSEAKQLFEDAQDGKGITGTEFSTLEYLLKQYKFTDKAANWLTSKIKASPTTYYKLVDGVKYDAALLLEVEAAGKDGQISDAEAKRLWDSALDGKGVTVFEKATLQYALDTYKFTEPAKKFLTEKMTTV